MALLSCDSLKLCTRCSTRISCVIGRESDLLESILSPNRLQSRYYVTNKISCLKNKDYNGPEHCRTNSSLSGKIQNQTFKHGAAHQSRYQSFMNRKLSHVSKKTQF